MADNEAMKGAHQNILENIHSSYNTEHQCDSELNQSISAWERRATAAWKDANEAEAQGQPEDWDYYVDLAELCEEMAWNTRIQRDTGAGNT